MPRVFFTIAVAILFSFFSSVNAHTVVETVAGNGARGFQDGNPSALYYPDALAYNSSGLIYITDRFNHSIRILNTADNTVSTLLNNGRGDLDGSFSVARLNGPTDIAIDSEGNLIVADSHNHKIKKINLAAQTVETIAGTGSWGYRDDYNPLDAKFYYPAGIALDSQDNIYVAEWGNDVVRKISANDGTVSTFIGRRYFSSYDRALLRDIAINSSETALYVTEFRTNKIKKIDLDTKVVSILAGGAYGYEDSTDPLRAKFKNLMYLHVDGDENIYVTEFNGHKIRRIDGQTQAVTTVAGASGIAGLSEGSVNEALFGQCSGITTDDTGALYVTSKYTHVIQKIYDPSNNDQTGGDEGNDGEDQAGGDEGNDGEDQAGGEEGNDGEDQAGGDEGNDGEDQAGGDEGNDGEDQAGSNEDDGEDQAGSNEDDGDLTIPEEDSVPEQIIDDDSGEIFIPGDTNTKPSIELVTNLTNQVNADGEYQIVRAQNLILEAVAYDLEDDPDELNARINWRTNLGGLVGTGRFLELSNLSLGKHTISLSVKDSYTVKDEIFFVINLVETVDQLDLDDGRKQEIADEIERILNPNEITGDISIQIIDIDRKKKFRKRFKKKGLIRALAWAQSTEISSAPAQNISDQIIWSSDLDGDIARGPKVLLKKVLKTFGEHVITAIVGGESTSLRVELKRKRGKKIIKKLND